MDELSRRRLIGGAAAAAAVGCLLPTRVDAGPLPSLSGLPWASGAFEDAPDRFATWRGRKCDVLMWYTPNGTWFDIADKTASNLHWFAFKRSGTTRREAVIVSYPLFPKNQNPKAHGMSLWTRAADGEFDSHHRTAAARMGQIAGLAGIASRLVFRIAWEWNNGAMPWVCHDVAYAGAYKTYWSRVARLLKQVLPGCKVDWSCAKKGKTFKYVSGSKVSASIDNFYPGSAVVDFVGPNGYDFWPSITDQREWDLNYMKKYGGGPAGIGAWLEYAKLKGKPLSIGEWGLIQKERGGGGDNALFIRKMLEFCRANAADIGYESYFNKDTGGLLHRLDGTYPEAGAEYRRQMAL